MKPYIKSSAIAIALMMFACDSGPTDYIGEGWAFFSAGELDQAYATFLTPAAQNDPEAFVGLGWVCVELDSMPSADRYFALAAADSLSNGYAGWALTLWARSDYTGCLDKAAFVLRHESSYRFEFKTTIDYKDLIWYQAESYLHLGNNSACLSKIQALDPSFTANLGAANIADVLATKLENLAGTLF